MVSLVLCLICCCRFKSNSNVGVDARVGLKAMSKTISRLQKVRGKKVPGLATTDFRWLDDALKPLSTSAPSASVRKSGDPPSRKKKAAHGLGGTRPNKTGQEKTLSDPGNHGFKLTSWL